ncbi:LemA family protein [Motiliproteus sediminis]|uniref:LemA family protein n=1 Tax=Motiliproteus sediminis TaxID=1468178 RepID=UPI001AEF92C4|nr:LemA family protein [Motiliproteus sediminis]
MDISTLVILATLAVVVVYFITIYNALVQLKHNVSKAWANIDVLLKQRHDELPKLVETCKQYMGYEKDALEAIIKARSAVSDARQSADMKALGAAETQLRIGLGNLFALAEDYPDLKANDSFQHLQSRITGLEQDIADRREFYNESVNLLNVRIEQFPDVIVARKMGFRAADLLEFSEAEKADVDMKALFS